ncbi:MAG: radical SAM protein [Candidatus Omnitrophica bacterium]|nr:radical SAM protein [Candidatus Omnitrophota bacterium]MDE2008671.1 radical SAM protein [Candidatus Omnitrophota bacterium]MDE2214812.1 radical SAM protein [Candidatus Omnitrophota bacterium]MDE2230885.1 radical SAM protein [Candidatus Omnitrophota bacterium]
MNCVYCQLGKTSHLTDARKEYVPTGALVEEVRRLPLFFVDYLTFSGRGEPTLAGNLGDMIRSIKTYRREHVAVITNSSLLHQKDVQDDLAQADFVLAKLDTSNQASFQNVNGGNLDFEKTLQGLLEFRCIFKGKFALQIMLIDDNLDNISGLATITRDLCPDEVQLNTPLRPCAIKPIERPQMQLAKEFFHGQTVVTVWDAPSQAYTPFDEQATVKRHGNFVKTRYGF